MPTPRSMVTTAKLEIPRPAPNHSSASVSRLVSLSKDTGSPSVFDSRSRSGISVSSITGDHFTIPRLASTSPGKPIPTALMSDITRPDFSNSLSMRELTSDNISSVDCRSDALATWASAMIVPARSSKTAVWRSSDSFMPTTKRLCGATRRAMGGRPRLGPRWLSSTSCSRPRAIRSEVMVVTDPGLMLSLRATSMRGICPFARTCSNTCWRSGRVSSCGKASSGPQPEDTSFDPFDPRSRISSLAKLYPPDVF